MAPINLDRLVGVLSSGLRVSLELAASTAVQGGHRAVDIVHWLHVLAGQKDFGEMIGAAGVDVAQVKRELDEALREMRREDPESLTLSQNVLSLTREAWLIASLQFGRNRIETGDLLIALLADQSLRMVLRGIAPSLRSLDVPSLEKSLAAIPVSAPAASSGEAGGARQQSQLGLGGGLGDDEFLKLYAKDITQDARDGRIDPVIGRDRELRQLIDILLRRRQNNPILVGEAGVGKTAIVEAFALQIISGDVPEKLRNVRLLSLDLSLLQAGAGVKGEFERRLRGVVDAVKASVDPIILFIDEAHTLMGGAGGTGQGDAANILKPSLARGELRTVAATTWTEYKRYIEKDPALTRRFQPIKVDEPDEATAIRMLRTVVSHFEKHHGVKVRDDALTAAVRLSARYITARQLPDKAVSLIDTASASVALSRQTQPELLRDCRRELELLALEEQRLLLEPATEESIARLGQIAASRQATERQMEDAEKVYLRQLELAHEADAIEAEIDSQHKLEVRDPKSMNGAHEAAAPSTPLAETVAAETEKAAGSEDKDALRKEALDKIAALDKQLDESAHDLQLVQRVVSKETIAGVVSRWTGIPLGRLLSEQAETVKTLDARLKERIIGQDEAIDRIAASVRIARSGLSDPRRPPGVFLLAGPSGIGKTETALALTDLLYGGTQSLTTINMSEFKEEHKISMLLGSPPGYVGFGEGGVLTEAVRRRPFGVLLLDEIDKAHPSVQEIFYQVFDKGTLRDGEGRDIDFKNTTIMMTANSGSEFLNALAETPETMPQGSDLEAALTSELSKHFKPAFLGRATILPYLPLDSASLSRIVDLQIGRIQDRVHAVYRANVVLADEARALLVSRAKASDIGARAIEIMIARDLLPVLSVFFLNISLGNKAARNLRIGVKDDNFVIDYETSEAQTSFAVDDTPAAGTAALKSKKVRKNAKTQGGAAVSQEPTSF